MVISIPIASIRPDAAPAEGALRQIEANRARLGPLRASEATTRPSTPTASSVDGSPASRRSCRDAGSPSRPGSSGKRPRPPDPRRPDARVPRWATRGALREIDPDGLGLGVVLETGRAHLAPEPRFLEPAKRQRRVKEVVGVHPHGAGADRSGSFKRLRSVTHPPPPDPSLR